MVKKKDYQIFVLRVWQDNEATTDARCSLEDTQTGKRIGFPDLEALGAYLQEAFGWPAVGRLLHEEHH